MPIKKTLLNVAGDALMNLQVCRQVGEECLHSLDPQLCIPPSKLENPGFIK